MKIIIEGIAGLDGEYDLDLENQPFTNGELHLIKDVAKVRAGELREALDAGDNDVFVAFALIALERSGRPTPVRLFWEAPAGQITFSDNGQPAKEDDALPPASAPSGAGEKSEKSGSS